MRVNRGILRTGCRMRDVRIYRVERVGASVERRPGA
jgi:hypothetical protein